MGAVVKILKCGIGFATRCQAEVERTLRRLSRILTSMEEGVNEDLKESKENFIGRRWRILLCNDTCFRKFYNMENYVFNEVMNPA